VRGLAHGLAAAAEHHGRLVEQDLLRALDDGLEAGSAEAVDRECRHLDGKARVQPHVPGEVDGIGRRLLRVPEDDVIYLFRPDLRTLERVPGRDGRELDGGEVLEDPAELAEPRTDAGEKHHVCVLALGLHRLAD